jgi:thiamine pyrophosphokinase
MDYIIILNGDKPIIEKDFFAGKKVICADGAYRYAQELGINADLIIGDFDSFDINDLPQNIEVKKFSSDKDETDGELALNEAISRGAENIYIIGAGGRREDHFFANIILLYIALKNGVNAKIISDYSEILMFDGDISLNVKKGYYLSIVPFKDSLHIINTEGLKYKISDGIISYDNTLGISNVITEDTVKISVKSGCGIIFITKERAF